MLTSVSHWESLYQDETPERHPRNFGPLAPLLELTKDYDDYLLWTEVYAKHLPKQPGALAFEIGSAPGSFLVRLQKVFGYEPFGIDYSLAGAARNRELFRRNGIDPRNVFEGDVFSASFLEENRERYDLVISRGFIEHFSDPASVIGTHLDLLKAGGSLLVTIPSLKGLNYLLTRFLNPDLLALHNLSIMDLASFQHLFPPERVRPTFCGYVGTLNLNLSYAPSGSPLRHVDTALVLTQRLLNVPLRLLFKTDGFELPGVSPRLVFIGQKL